MIRDKNMIGDVAVKIQFALTPVMTCFTNVGPKMQTSEKYFRMVWFFGCVNITIKRIHTSGLLFFSMDRTKYLLANSALDSLDHTIWPILARAKNLIFNIIKTNWKISLYQRYINIRRCIQITLLNLKFQRLPLLVFTYQSIQRVRIIGQREVYQVFVLHKNKNNNSGCGKDDDDNNKNANLTYIDSIPFQRWYCKNNSRLRIQSYLQCHSENEFQNSFNL